MESLIDKELMEIGRTGIIPEKGIIVGYFPECSSHAYMIYDEERISQYSEEEIISLFKGLVIAEKELHWHCGSTSPAAHVYQIITSKQLDPEYLLADWAFQFSDNEYVPFGFIRHGERTAHEYINWRNEYQNRLIQERLDKEERKRQKQTRALEIMKQKEAIDERNRQEYKKIFQMPPIQQVDYILNDGSHNILFYMPVINRLLDIDNINAEIYRPILDRLSNMAPTPFNLKLINRIESRLDNLNL